MPKPFYLIGHNTNAISEIHAGLEAGLNAFEIDINRDEHGQLFVSHDVVRSSTDSRTPAGGSALPPRLAPFLMQLQKLVSGARGAYALTIFDCKVDDPALADRLLSDVRTYLTDQGKHTHVIYSVASIAHARRFFAGIHGRLTPFEGLMVDEESEAAKVAEYFREFSVARAGYGNGVTTLPVIGVGLPSPNLVSQMDVAAAIAAHGELGFFYPWVLNRETTMREHIQIGVSGLMVDVQRGRALASIVANDVRLRQATDADDPFLPRHPIVLEIVTSDISHSGTDAAISFTLSTDSGATYTRVLDSAHDGRLERGTTTWVSLWDSPLELKAIRRLTISNDGSGNAPDWHLDSVTLKALDQGSTLVTFDQQIAAHQTVTKPVSVTDT